MKSYYQDDAVTIYHGDCREILPQLEPVDLVVTSPPYNINNSEEDLGHGRNWHQSKWIGQLLTYGYLNDTDDLPQLEYEVNQTRILASIWSKLTSTGAIFYNHKPRVKGTKLWTPLVIGEAAGLELRQIIIWARAGGVNFSITHYLPTTEWILLFAKPGFRLRDQGASGIGDIWYVPQQNNNQHPAPFPIGIPMRAIETTTAQAILDPFMGSGTTLRAAKDLGRKAIGIEIEEKYCEIAARRMAQEVLRLEA